MAKRLFLVGLLVTAFACKSRETGDSESMMSGGSGVTAAGAEGRDAVERALMALGIDGRVLRVDLNGADWKGGRIRVAQVHLLSDLFVLETGGKNLRVCALRRDGLEPRWISGINEPTAFPAAEGPEALLLVSEHYVHVLQKASGLRAMEYVGGKLDGLPRPHLKLPFQPTAGAAAQNDTLYIPSLGSAVNNKTIESFSLVNGARGWGYRTTSEVFTSPAVGGDVGDPKLYFVTRTGHVICMDANNYGYSPSGPRWEELVEAGVEFPLFVTGDSRAEVGAVFVVDNDGVVYCPDRITGARRWNNATGRLPVSGAQVFGNIVVAKMKSGLIGYESHNVFYVLTVAKGPDTGKVFPIRGGRAFTLGSGGEADFVLSDSKIDGVHLNLEIQGEVFSGICPGAGRMKVDGGQPTKRANLVNGTRIVLGDTELVVADRGSEPLWADLPYDRIVVRSGDKLIASQGTSLIPLDAWTGEPVGEPVSFAAARFIPTNMADGNLFVVAGEAIVYGLFVR